MQLDYHMDNTLLEAVSEENDLGVVVGNKLKFVIHTEKHVIKTTNILALPDGPIRDAYPGVTNYTV